jgi:hypothetical protein
MRLTCLTCLENLNPSLVVLSRPPTLGIIVESIISDTYSHCITQSVEADKKLIVVRYILLVMLWYNSWTQSRHRHRRRAAEGDVSEL